MSFCLPACQRPGLFSPVLDLRVDVSRPPDHVRGELRELAQRVLPAALEPVKLGGPGLPPTLTVQERHAGGDVYMYVYTRDTQRLVGYVAFQQIPEAGRRARKHVRSPHALFHPAYQRQGLGTALYGAILARGYGLVSGARQSPGAHALWQALGRRHTLAYVQVGGRQWRHLGQVVDGDTFDDLQTRLLLLPAGLDVDDFAQASGLLPADAWSQRPPTRPPAAWRLHR